jgi:class 3 adenylate cyclase/tetratricopeptide (TPR) repeat protein
MPGADDLRRWLHPIGLEELADTLAANDIDLDLLPELSDEDLKELGLSLGHRRRLLRAIGEMASVRPAPAVSTTAPASDSGADSTARDAERRQLTVLFCDLVGSTELSGQHDPEDLRELLRRYHDAMTEVVLRFGGHVANYLGDGILAYFGWPRAEEDEAMQAVRAGLAAVAAAKELALHVHVGIASGTVVVGDLETAGRRQAGAIAGETPNLAARLEALAGADQVVIGGLTRQLVGAAFILDDLGPQELKGIAEPVRVWQVLAERSTESRFDAHAGRLTRFIGREHEVALLLDRFERAAAGEGQAVLLSGEAGIGKSRIIRQLHERLSRIPHTRMRFQCSPSHMERALYPVSRHLEYAAGFQPGDEPATRLDKLEALLRQAVEDVAESAALLAPLLSLPAERYGTIELTAEQRSERTFKALIDQLLGLAAENPVLYILEDAHWLDPTMRELMTRTLGRIADARVLIVITHRPEFQSDWTRHPQVTALTLSRLSRGQGAEVAWAAGGEALSEEIVTRILRRADGVPLYIEELTRSVVETGTAGGDDIPETLQASLLARLDRLGADAKEAAQLAAVIGREFGGALLGAVSGKFKDEVDRSLQRLVTSEIVLPTGPPPDDAYAFRHALLQDAAYQSLLLSRRRQYHGEIARALEQRFPEMAEDQPGLVAQHYTAAQQPEQAIPYWLRAGERALARQAFHEPAAHFAQGLELARALPEGPSRSRHVLDLLLALGETQQLAGRQLGAALATFKEAAEIARTAGSPTDLARAALGADNAEANIGVLERESVSLLEAALDALGEEDGVDRSRVLGRLGRALSHLGDSRRASEFFSEAIALARRCGDLRAIYDALVCQHVTTTGFGCPSAKFSERRRALDESVAAAEAIGDPSYLVPAEMWRFAGSLEMGDYAAFAASLKRCGELIEKHQVSNFIWGVRSGDALHAILRGEFAVAERLADKALEIGGEVHGEFATGVYGVQMFTIRREQGRLAEVAPLLRRFLDEHPEDAAWRPGLAVIASDLGFDQAAQRAFAEMATAGFVLAADAKRGLTLSYLSEVCARLGDVPRAEELYDLLLPYRDVTIIAPVATVCCGSAARYLGMLASVIGDWPRAEEHFAAALAIDERLKAWPWLAHTQYEFAAALLARGTPGCRVRADSLLAAAAETAQRLGMTALQQKIRSHAH